MSIALLVQLEIIQLNSSKRSPAPKPKSGLTIDWEKADKRLSEEIVKDALYIKNQPGRPLRVSLSELAKIIGNKSWLEKYLDRLPRTREALLNYLESSFDFSVRKIIWAEEQYITEGVCPTRNQFMHRAVLLNKTGQAYETQSMVDAVLMRLQDLD